MKFNQIAHPKWNWVEENLILVAQPSSNCVVTIFFKEFRRSDKIKKISKIWDLPKGKDYEKCAEAFM